MRKRSKKLTSSLKTSQKSGNPTALQHISHYSSVPRFVDVQFMPDDASLLLDKAVEMEVPHVSGTKV